MLADDIAITIPFPNKGMSTLGIVSIVLFIVILIVLIYSLVKVTEASTSLNGTTSSDSGIQTAANYVYYTAVSLWVTIALLVIGIICFIIFGFSLVPSLGGIVFYFVYFILIVALIAVGVLAALAASNIGSSPEKNKYADAYKDTIIAASVSLASLGIIIIAAIVFFALSRRKRSAEDVEDVNGDSILQESSTEVVDEDEA